VVMDLCQVFDLELEALEIETGKNLINPLLIPQFKTNASTLVNPTK